MAAGRPSLLFLLGPWLLSCGTDSTQDTGSSGAGGQSTGGVPASGGALTETGGTTGGIAPSTGGDGGGGSTSVGGTPSSGGTTGGASGGTPAGGTPSGGAPSGGTPSGGTSAGAGAGGDAPGGGGAGGSAGADPCATALFCDDFEDYTTGQEPDGAWTSTTRSGSLSVETTRASSGTKAVRFTTEQSSDSKTAYLRLEGSPVFPLAQNVLYGRMLFYLESAPEESVHWTFIQGGGLVPGESYHALYRYGGQQPVTQGGGFVGSQLMANYETPDSYSGNGPGSDCWHHADQTVVPVDRWACVEWKFDGPQNQMQLWLDGEALPDLTVTDTGQGCVNQSGSYVWTAPDFDRIDLGWESYQADDARTLTIDDVVLSESAIGCPAMP